MNKRNPKGPGPETASLCNPYARRSGGFPDAPLLPLITGSVLLLGLLFAALQVFPGPKTFSLEIPWITPLVSAFLAFSSLSAAVFAFGRYAVLPDRFSYWIATGFSVFAVQQGFYVLAWPELLPGGGSLIARLPGTASWIAAVSALTLGLFLIGAVAAHRSDGNFPSGPLGYFRAALWLALSSLVFVGLILFEESLPPMQTARLSFTTLRFAAGFITLLLFSAGAVFSGLRYRNTGSPRIAYLALAQVLLSFSSLAVMLGSRQFDLWWYLNRLLLLGGNLTVFFGLLIEFSGLLRSEAALRSTEEDLLKSHALINTITSGMEELIAAEDRNFRYLYFNDSYRREFQELWGKDPDSGSSMLELLAPWPDEQRKIRELWERALSGESFHVTREFGPPEKEKQIYDMRFNPLFDAHGRQIGAAHIIRNITLQIRMQEKLHRSELRFRHIADSMPHLVWTAKADGTIDYYNSRWSEYEGIHPNEDGSWSWQMVLHPEDRAPTVAAWTRALETGSIYESEHRVKMRDGSYCWHFSRGVPVRDNNGVVSKWYGSATNIQSLKAAEAEVRRNEEHYRRALQDSGLVAARVDTDLRYQWVYNPHPDFDSATVLGKRDDELSPPEDAAGIMALKREVIEKGVSLQRELSFERSDGTRWYVMRGEPLFGSDGGVIGLTTVSLDITERRRIETVLRENEERFRTLADNISQFAWMADETGWIFWYNRRWFEYTGTTLEEMQGWGWRNVHHPDHVERVVGKISRCFQTGEVWEDTFPLRGRDGTYRWFLSRAIPIRNAEGKVVRWFGTNTDISELRESEMNLARAKEQAEQANRAKSEFLAHMSHELRTPIGGIIGMTDVLAPRIREPEQQNMVSLIKESAETLLGIIGDILDLSRIEAGEVAVEAVEYETRSMINSVVNLFLIPAEEKGLKLSLDVKNEVPEFIRADREKIAQILRNLISNAIKYTRRGSVRVAVDADPPKNGRVCIRFQVEDTGVGIPEESMQSIFSSFVRLRNSVTIRNVEGTGLGLSISKRLADLLKGTLEVESSPGSGSTFTFSVDVQEIKVVNSSKPIVDSSGIASLPPLRILLVEDNRINQMFVQMMLSESGHTVTVAEHGKEAVEQLESSEEGYDLVLMDVQMPVMDGIEATRRIRRSPGFISDIPIIALTAFAMAGDEDRFRKAGMDGYVTKPVDWGELARVIRELGVI